MFKTEKYKIRFERLPINDKSNKNGRYDTGCGIYLHNYDKPEYIGIAHLHPKDIPDKIIGKKEALKRALYMVSKPERTKIWKAFWQWVESWKETKRK